MRTTLTGTAVAAPRARHATLVGSVLDDRYDVIEKIASGGFGSIYRANDRTNGIEVALKVLHRELARDASLATRFRREAEILGMLRDPRTVAMYGHGETADGTLYIALELLHGESLEQKFARGPMPWREVMTIIRDACSALSEAHARGIVHRDLKPGNIFVADEGTKVIDFGIAKLVETTDGADLTRIGQAVGTLDYMAPEQLVGGDCDGRTDIYTLGVVAYEAITGVRPFADAAGLGLITALLTRTPLAPSMRVQMPAELDALILKCLEREPDDRFASIDAMVIALDRVLFAGVEIDDEITNVDVTAPAPKLAPDELLVRPEASKPSQPVFAEPMSEPVFAESVFAEPVSEPVFAEGTIDEPKQLALPVALVPVPAARPSRARCYSKIALAAAALISAGAAIFAIA